MDVNVMLSDWEVNMNQMPQMSPNNGTHGIENYQTIVDLLNRANFLMLFCEIEALKFKIIFHKIRQNHDLRNKSDFPPPPILCTWGNTSHCHCRQPNSLVL